MFLLQMHKGLWGIGREASVLSEHIPVSYPKKKGSLFDLVRGRWGQ
jgi:hypothetical protein